MAPISRKRGILCPCSIPAGCTIQPHHKSAAKSMCYWTPEPDGPILLLQRQIATFLPCCPQHARQQWGEKLPSNGLCSADCDFQDSTPLVQGATSILRLVPAKWSKVQQQCTPTRQLGQSICWCSCRLGWRSYPDVLGRESSIDHSGVSYSSRRSPKSGPTYIMHRTMLN